jgi:hypothetical protein
MVQGLTKTGRSLNFIPNQWKVNEGFLRVGVTINFILFKNPAGCRWGGLDGSTERIRRSL